MLYKDFSNRFMLLMKDELSFSIIDPDHPLYIYGGYNNNRQPTFMILNEQAVDTRYIKSTQGITVKNIQRKDGRYALQFSFSGKDCSLFLRLCYDLLESTRNISPDVAFQRLISRYQAWYNMLSGVRPDILSPNQQKGLCGELLYLLEEIDNIGAELALESWRGPHGADQDFINQNHWTEVKSVGLSSDNVTISSLEQLAPLTSGFLAVYKIEETTNIDSECFSLYSLVQRVEQRIAQSVNAGLLFAEKLYLSNCIISEPVYKDTYFVVKDFALYEVRDCFPRLTAEVVPSGITSAKYSISLASINEYKVR